MARRNIQIDVGFTVQRVRSIKNVLHDALFDNLNKKSTVYTNTAPCLDHIQSENELWLVMNDDIKGNALVINGGLKPEVNFSSAERFTRVITHSFPGFCWQQ